MNQLRGGAGDSAYLEQELMDLKKIVSSLRSDRDTGVLRYGQPGQGGPIPVGGIIMWSGAIADIPTGWALCDGSNNTPDLRGKFIIGAGGSYDPEDTGGAATAGPLAHAGAAVSAHAGTAVSSHAGTAVSAHAGTAVAAHSQHVHAAGTPDFGAQAGGSANVWRASTDSAQAGPTTHTVTQPNNHTVTQPNDHTVTQPSNHTVTQPNDHTAFSILPPFFALAYIMRTG